MTRRLCFTCDLKNDPLLIKSYKKYHQSGKIWPEITESIRAKGIESMQIYLTGNRLLMIVEVDESYDPKDAKSLDLANPKVREWEELMSTFQEVLPWAKEGQKWVEMEMIFDLNQG